MSQSEKSTCTLSVDREQRRHYGDEAGRYWSVSQVCEVVAGKNEFYAAGASERGTDVHTIFALAVGHSVGWCEAPDVPEVYAGYYRGIVRWIEATNPQPMMLERSLKHKTLGYAGTPDYVGMLGQDFGVLDLKTGQPAKWHLMQVRAYKELVQEAKKMWVLYLADDGTYKQTTVKSWPRDWAAFQNGISILNWRESK